MSRLRVDSQGWDSGLSKGRKSLGGFVKNVTSGFAQIGLAVNGMKTAFSLVAEPIELAKIQALSERKLEQVFKTTGNAAGLAADEIKKFAAERQNLTSFGDEATIDAAAILGSFTSIKGNTFKDALVSAQDLSAFLGTDLQSSVIMIGKALNDPARGMTALSKSGIQFSKSQKEQIKALQETGDIAGAQAIILKELQTQFGGQAEALVDPIQQAKNAWGDFLEIIGGEMRDRLLPLMPKIIEGISKMADVAGKAFEKIAAISEKIAEFSKIIEQASGKNLFEHLAPGLSTIGELMEGDVKGGGLGGMAGAMKKGRDEQIGKNWTVNPKAGPQTLEEMYAKEAKDREEMLAKQWKNPAEQAMAGFIRNGIAGMQSGLMSLGPLEKAEKFSNQVGSLEKNSQASYDVLRANVGPGGKDKVQEQQLTEQKKQTKKLDEIAKNLGKSAGASVLKVMGLD